MQEQIVLGVEGMHCTSCEKLIKLSLEEKEGIERVEASFPREQVKVYFHSEKISEQEIAQELAKAGYAIKASEGDSSESNSSSEINSRSSIKEGIIYGLVPHIGCIGFIIASVLGVTVAIEFFKPLLLNPWFFHILVLVAIGFATISSAIYLRKHAILSWEGVKRKKKYLAAMYGSTVGINLLLFILVFPMLANLDTGSLAHPTGQAALAGPKTKGSPVLALEVGIPCPGHAPLISGELKTILGVTGVRFNFPNRFDVAFDPQKTSSEEILSLEVFETYPATILSETGSPSATMTDSTQEISFSGGIKEVETQKMGSSVPAGACGISCGASCGRTTCGCGG